MNKLADKNSNEVTTEIQDEKPSMEKVDKGEGIFYASSFFIDRAIIAILLGALGYFIGYRFLYAYYGSFGLDQSFFRFSPTDIIIAGWRIYLITGLAILAAIFSIRVSHKLLGQIIKSKGDKTLIFTFFAIIYLCLILFFIWLLIYITNWKTYLILEFFIWSGAILFLLWIAFLVGNEIHIFYKKVAPTTKSEKLFASVFPSPVIWISIISLFFIMEMGLLSSYNAATYAGRDKSSTSTLQIFDFCASQELNISLGSMAKQGEWCYSDLRFLIESDDTYFVFRPNENLIDITTLYAIPKTKVIDFKLRSWWAKYNQP